MRGLTSRCDLRAVGAGGGPELNCLWRPRGYSEWADEDHDEVKYGGGDKKAEHPVRGNPGQIKRVLDITGESNTSAGKQFIQDDFDGVEGIKSLGLGATGDARIIVALAETPQTDLIEVVKAD